MGLPVTLHYRGWPAMSLTCSQAVSPSLPRRPNSLKLALPHSLSLLYLAVISQSVTISQSHFSLTPPSSTPSPPAAHPVLSRGAARRPWTGTSGRRDQPNTTVHFCTAATSRVAVELTSPNLCRAATAVHRCTLLYISVDFCRARQCHLGGVWQPRASLGRH